MDLQDTVNALAARVAKLEAARPRKRVYNQQEAAAELGMSVNKFRTFQRAGLINGILNGKTWMFADEELQRYVERQAEEDAA
jgi:hypothetical protein